MERWSLTRRSFLRGGSLVLGGLAAGPSLAGIAGCRQPGGGTVERPALDAGGALGPDAALDAALDADAATAAAPAPLVDPRAGVPVELDLVRHLHLADVDHLGVFIDFGTPARHKYTLGSWRTGWGEDDRDGDTALTWATVSPARLYFHLERRGPIQLVLRARRERHDTMSVYVNDHAVTSVTLGEEWSEHVVAVEAAHTRPGENALKLVHRGRGGRRHAFAVDWLRIVPGAREPVRGEAFTAPTAPTLLGRRAVGDREETTLELRAPTRLSWFLEVPAAASLGFAAGAVGEAPARLAVTVTDATTGEAERVHERAHGAGEELTPALVDLSEHGGRVVRLDVEVAAEGEETAGTIALASPAFHSGRGRVTAGGSAIEARHVVVLLIDTLRADRLRAYGSRTRVETPETEHFAADATLFERCQAPANWTKPSCASLLTGLHPPSHGALSESNSLPRRVTMLSELYQEAGFQTSAFVANGYLATDFGFNRGWHRYRNYIRERRPTEAEHVFGDTLTWMEEHRDERMFVYVHTIDPHVPYDPPDADLRRYDARPYSGPVRNRSTGILLDEFKRGRVELSSRDRERLEALYDGEITYHDRCFGQFLTRLGELGLSDSTLLVVTSDHGEEFFERDSVGHGHSLFQELLHVPLFFRLPGAVPRGGRLGQVCSLVDVAPTVLEASGLDVPDSMEGRSLVRDLTGAPPPPLGAAFSSQWDTGNRRELSWTARLADWKLRMHGPAISYLTNLSRDPGETRDVDDDHPIALRAARIALGQFLGAPERRRWARAAAPRRRPAAPRRSEDAAMTPELCAQLRALGYLDVPDCGD